MKPELLAPCGSISALKQAVYNGADAVYLGLQAFNARIKADNFTTENIADTVRFCHIYGVKVYVTVNISVKENEMKDMRALIFACKNANVDAFIISDLAVYSEIAKIAPEIPMHASTQMGISNLYGAKFIENLGFTRVVLARETTLYDIKEIHENTKLELEYFIQGALCVAFSGKCLLSSIISGNSGNRGRCLQPCRLKFKNKDNGKEGYLLSTSDLCLATHLKDLTNAGITSFKIEGRLRRDSYVRDVVKTYRKIINNNYNVTKNDLNILKSAFNRGNFSAGYAFTKNTNDLMSTKIQGNIGVNVGIIERAFVNKNRNFARIKKGNIKIENGDGYKLLNKNGYEVSGGLIKNLVIKNDLYIFECEKARRGYALNLTSRQSENFDIKKLPIDIKFEVDNENFAKITVKYNEIKCSIKSREPFEKSQKYVFDNEYYRAQLDKLGNTNFYLKSFDCAISKNVFIPKSVLNSLRREIIYQLEEEILSLYNKQKKYSKLPEISKTIMKNGVTHSTLLAIELQNESQLSDYIVKSADYIIFYPFEYNDNIITNFLKKAKTFNNNAKIYLKLAPNANCNDIKIYKKIIKNSQAYIDGIYCDNFYAVEIAKEFNLKAFLGMGLNIFNTETLNYFSYNEYLVSPELNINEIKNFNSPFVFAYGFMPLMNFSHCVQKLNYNSSCKNCDYKSKITYIDRKNYNFDIYRNKVSSCYFTLYNSEITDITAKLNTFAYNYYLNMLQLNSENIERVIRAFRDKKPLNSENFTYGHLLRGVD